MAALTKPQADLLREIEPGSLPVSMSYAPAKALVKKGLAYWKDAMFCDVLAISDAGIAALESTAAKEGGE